MPLPRYSGNSPMPRVPQWRNASFFEGTMSHQPTTVPPSTATKCA